MSDGMRLEPQVVLVDALLDQVARGELRVPQFQRPFVWRPEQMLDLFDSIESGYPIGSLLVWQTDHEVPALPRIGEIEIPTSERRMVSYVLDGHQRLSTLFGVLRRDRDAPRTADQRDWKWWVYRDLQAGGDRYRHYRRQDSAPEYFLPLRAVSKTMDFLEFSRGLEIRNPKQLEELVRAAEAVAHKIKNYQISLTRLVGGSLTEAVEVYTRLNRTGTRIDADQMVSALTYPATTRPPLASRIDEIVAGVAETGFGVVPREAVFRTVLAVAGEQDVMSPRWEVVAGRLQDRLHDAVPRTETAVRAAVAFLRTRAGLSLAKFLPYSHQLMLIAIFFHACDAPSETQQYVLRRWFWVTSWTNAFAGANSSTIKRAVQEMKGFAVGDSALAVDTGEVRPFPDAFNLNSARTRAYIAWELQEFPKRLDPAGNEFDVVELLASADSRIFRQVVDRESSPANRVVLPTPPGRSVRQALVELWAPDPAAVLASHGIPRTAWDRLREGDAQGFVRDRAEHLGGRLRRFVRELNVAVTGSLFGSLVGAADDDTE